mmetsp:Transcript_49864/g.156055  ORF Transcript_49864/g.156055 Transcript_49864/m.156055 type:complete len:511 (-) Transcript_49864:526-2058(-)
MAARGVKIERQECPECGSVSNSKNEDGSITCDDCGTVLVVGEEMNEDLELFMTDHGTMDMSRLQLKAIRKSIQPEVKEEVKEEALEWQDIVSAFQRFVLAITEAMVISCGASPHLRSTVGSIFRKYVECAGRRRRGEGKGPPPPWPSKFGASGILLPPSLALSVNLLGCLHVREPIACHDIVRWAQEGEQLPYFSYWQHLPENLRRLMRPREEPKQTVVHKLAVQVAMHTEIEVPPINASSLIVRFAAELELSRSCIPIALRFLACYQSDGLSLLNCTEYAQPHVHAIAYCLMAKKMLKYCESYTWTKPKYHDESLILGSDEIPWWRRQNMQKKLRAESRQVPGEGGEQPIWSLKDVRQIMASYPDDVGVQRSREKHAEFVRSQIFSGIKIPAKEKLWLDQYVKVFQEARDSFKKHSLPTSPRPRRLPVEPFPTHLERVRGLRLSTQLQEDEDNYLHRRAAALLGVSLSCIDHCYVPIETEIWKKLGSVSDFRYISTQAAKDILRDMDGK